MIFEVRTRLSKGCANAANFEWRINNFRRGAPKHFSALTSGEPTARYRRDVSEATKYIETAIVIDKAMVSSTRPAQVVEYENDNAKFAIRLADSKSNPNTMHWFLRSTQVLDMKKNCLCGAIV